jgi:hypothetical protein
LPVWTLHICGFRRHYSPAAGKRGNRKRFLCERIKSRGYITRTTAVEKPRHKCKSRMLEILCWCGIAVPVVAIVFKPKPISYLLFLFVLLRNLSPLHLFLPIPSYFIPLLNFLQFSSFFILFVILTKNLIFYILLLLLLFSLFCPFPFILFLSAYSSPIIFFNNLTLATVTSGY